MVGRRHWEGRPVPRGKETAVLIYFGDFHTIFLPSFKVSRRLFFTQSTLYELGDSNEGLGSASKGQTLHTPGPQVRGSAGHSHHLAGPSPPLDRLRSSVTLPSASTDSTCFCHSPSWQLSKSHALCGGSGFLWTWFSPACCCTAPTLYHACPRSWGLLHEQGRQTPALVALAGKMVR